MSREHTSGAPRRVSTQLHGGSAPARGRGSRAPARPAGGETVRSARTKALLFLALVVLSAGALLLRVGALHASAVGPWAVDVSGSRRSGVPATQTIDRQLLLVPRTVRQAATASGVRMDLTVGPLLPGSNRFELRPTEHGLPLTGARVLLTARMTGMAMRPVMLPMREIQPGRYAATGPLAMFGRWQVTMQIDRSGTASLRHQFTVSVDLPSGLLTAPTTLGTPQQ